MAVNKTYSGYDKLPNYVVGNTVTKGCIVLEGGAFRGLYTSGVLDALMEADINMECTIGVSAGAMNGIAYATGVAGYSARVNLGHRHDSKYVGLGAWKINKGIIGFDIAFSAPDGIPKMDFSRIPAQGRRYVAVPTSCITGKEEYFECDGTDKILEAVSASASMPYVSRPVMINGKPYLDGGCACKIPYRWALAQGYEKIIIVKTRPDGFRKAVKNDTKHDPARIFYREFPAFADSLSHSNADYNRQCDEIDKLKASGRAFVLSPSGAVTVGRLEKDVEKLGKLYEMGYNDTKACMPELRLYLGID